MPRRKAAPPPATANTDELVAKSEAMRRVISIAERAAMDDVPVLLRGERNAGKEHIAEYMHHRSPRHDGPFCVFDGEAAPEELVESALFGHAKGAFLGAVADRTGMFEEASGGTALIIEIGRLSASMQSKVLRVLRDGVINRVGSTELRKVDVRLIATSSRDLAPLVQKRSKELYERLHVLAIDVPPLRARHEDIVPLAHRFLRRLAPSFENAPCILSAKALDRLLAYSWPENVTELETAIARALFLAQGSPRIEESHLPAEIAEAEAEELAPLAELERHHILRALERCGGNRKETAKMLGIAPNTLWRKLTEYGLVKRRSRRRKN
jgi:two-component system, NtrC family, response regulator HydG